MNQCVDQCPNARLTVIGKGDTADETTLCDKAERPGIVSSGGRLGYVNDEAGSAVYAPVKVPVRPTVYDKNGMVAAEALCSGLPAVMFDPENPRAVCTSGRVKAPEGDRAAFAGEVTRLLRDDKYRAGIAPDPNRPAAFRARWDRKLRISEVESFPETIDRLNHGHRDSVESI